MSLICQCNRTRWRDSQTTGRTRWRECRCEMWIEIKFWSGSKRPQNGAIKHVSGITPMLRRWRPTFATEIWMEIYFGSVQTIEGSCSFSFREFWRSECRASRGVKWNKQSFIFDPIGNKKKRWEVTHPVHRVLKFLPIFLFSLDFTALALRFLVIVTKPSLAFLPSEVITSAKPTFFW
jgi:hypothetical protein